MTDKAQWVAEFGEEYDMPAAVRELLAEGVLLDQSWHNDVAPSFSHRDADPCEAHDLRIWVDHPSPDSRENEGWPRFSVVDCVQQGRTFYAGDYVGVALAVLTREAERLKALKSEDGSVLRRR